MYGGLGGDGEEDEKVVFCPALDFSVLSFIVQLTKLMFYPTL